MISRGGPSPCVVNSAGPYEPTSWRQSEISSARSSLLHTLHGHGASRRPAGTQTRCVKARRPLLGSRTERCPTGQGPFGSSTRTVDQLGPSHGSRCKADPNQEAVSILLTCPARKSSALRHQGGQSGLGGAGTSKTRDKPCRSTGSRLVVGGVAAGKE